MDPHAYRGRSGDATNARSDRLRAVLRSRRVPVTHLDEIERWFVDRGLPHFVERHDSAARDLGPGPAAARRRLPAARPQRPRPRRLERGREPRRRRRSSSPSLVVTWVVANRLRGRRWFERPQQIGPAELAVFIVVPGRAVARRRPVGRRAADGRRRRSPSSPCCGRSPATACSPLLRWAVAADDGPAAAAVQRRRPGAAAAAAVHDVPVHQRRGVAGGRHADRRRLRRRARHLLPARRGVRAVPRPAADARR